MGTAEPITPPLLIHWVGGVQGAPVHKIHQSEDLSLDRTRQLTIDGPHRPARVKIALVEVFRGAQTGLELIARSVRH
ncbi:hypothetical protein Rhe02_97080 [Rhizocola hellebori]|uniref:Uncharacterized protein n=1 Tax=Rhizocola hellebori TaxID=1392758 RepID=A0A8J3QJD1_9ACTN|nr:hypothetical protein Rhe02_97080 [Rhizocola hellebori]